MMVTEMFMDHVARTLGRPGHQIRQLNFYKEGDLTHFGMKLEKEQVRLSSSSVWQLLYVCCFFLVSAISRVTSPSWE
jgi:xanthine dehydrogenase molybdopterin-binding subunit B